MVRSSDNSSLFCGFWSGGVEFCSGVESNFCSLINFTKTNF